MYTAMVEQVKGNPAHQKILLAATREDGFVWDREAKALVDEEAA